MSQISGVVSDEREQTKINKWTSHGRFFYSMLKSWTIKYLSDYQLFFTEILIDFSITLFFFFIQQNLNIPTLCVRQPNLALFRVIYRFFFLHVQYLSVKCEWLNWNLAFYTFQMLRVQFLDCILLKNSCLVSLWNFFPRPLKGWGLNKVRWY